MGKKLLVVSVAALSKKIQLKNLDFHFMQSVFPALTCTAQASFRTAGLPSQHGMVANGFFHRNLKKALFWEQSSTLVQGSRIWENFQERGKRVAILFWQQSLGENADILISPAPIHKHHGGMIETCYSKPDGLYEEICRQVGRPFKLRHYWGPLASWKVGQWIVEATLALLSDVELGPDLCLTYLPTLDYDLQRKNPEDNQSCSKALNAVERQLSTLVDGAISKGYDIVVFGDYRVAPVSEAVFPNVHLR
jgi:predicted AlkP superfamily pyrophosphatase or phosphodiesterase